MPGIQLNHSGRKARSQRPWEGFGPLQGSDEDLWPVIAPSAIAHAEGWAIPREMTVADIREVIGMWAASARLAVEAGFEVLEIHGAHGYLVHQFLSPKANQRSDQYGGSPATACDLPSSSPKRCGTPGRSTCRSSSGSLRRTPWGGSLRTP